MADTTMPQGERFKKGDRVRVWYVKQPNEPNRFDAVYIAGPSGPGDTIKLMVDGKPVEINGNCSTFEGVWFRPGDKSEEDR